MKKICLIISLLFLMITHGREFEYAESEIPLEEPYPLITENLLPRFFTTKELSEALTTQANVTFPSNICVVGNDPLSLAWLNEDSIKMMLSVFTRDSYCVAVNLQSFDEFIELKSTFDDLKINIPLIPMKLEEFVKTYGIDRYPFIFTPSSGVFLQSPAK